MNYQEYLIEQKPLNGERTLVLVKTIAGRDIAFTVKELGALDLSCRIVISTHDEDVARKTFDSL